MRRVRFLIFSLVLLSAFICVSCRSTNYESAPLNQTVELEKGDIVQIENSDITIEMLGAGSEHGEEDHYADNLSLMLSIDQSRSREVFLETPSDSYNVAFFEGYQIQLDWASGYHQKAGIIISKR